LTVEGGIYVHARLLEVSALPHPSSAVRRALTARLTHAVLLLPGR
jgi:hypothetical protein